MSLCLISEKWARVGSLKFPIKDGQVDMFEGAFLAQTTTTIFDEIPNWATVARHAPKEFRDIVSYKVYESVVSEVVSTSYLGTPKDQSMARKVNDFIDHTKELEFREFVVRELNKSGHISGEFLSRVLCALESAEKSGEILVFYDSVRIDQFLTKVRDEEISREIGHANFLRNDTLDEITAILYEQFTLAINSPS